MNILGISGSLRAASLNTMLLRVAGRMAPSNVTFTLYDGLGDLPFFNPDIEETNPAVIVNLRKLIINSDALIIASPEYAHGITGALKNALDWMVGCEAFVNKPVALFNTSPRATHAQASLRETLNTMSAHIVEEASISLPLLGSKLTEEDMMVHSEISNSLSNSFFALSQIIWMKS